MAKQQSVRPRETDIMLIVAALTYHLTYVH